MRGMRDWTVCCIALVLIGVIEIDAQRTAPAILIDRKICPGEGCFYRAETKAATGIDVFRQPDPRSNKLFTIRKGTRLRGVDSQVHTVGGRFTVTRGHLKYRAGDTLRVYTYLGEGIYRVWHRGRMFEEDLGFSPWGGSTGTRCQDDPKSCWGTLDRTLNMKWWLKVRVNRGKTGWILVKDNLEWLDDSPGY